MGKKFCTVVSAFLPVALLATGCRPNASGQREDLAKMERRFDEISLKLDSLGRQLDALSNRSLVDVAIGKGSQLTQPSQATDASQRMKSALDTLATAYEKYPNRGAGRKWSADSYDIRKTDSLVSPLLATVTATLTREANFVPRSTYVATFALQDDQWILKSLGSTDYYQGGGERKTSVKVGDPTDPDYTSAEFLQQHFR